MLKQNESDRVNEKTGNPVIHVNYTYHPTIRHARNTTSMNQRRKKHGTADFGKNSHAEDIVRALRLFRHVM